VRKIKNSRKPIQVWEPLFYKSPYGDFLLDLQRAYKVWQNEDRIWLLPDARKTVRWIAKIGSFVSSEVAVPSKMFNSIIIYHIDEQGRIYPPHQSTGRLTNIIDSGLYARWLRSSPSFYTPGSVEIELPIIKNGKFCYYKKEELEWAPESVIPFSSIDNDSKYVLSIWPPPGSKIPPTTISTDTESSNYYGKLEAKKTVGKKGSKFFVSSEKNLNGKALGAYIKWPDPFDKFFYGGSSLDLLHDQACMKDVLRKIGKKELSEAIKEVERYINIFTGSTEASLEKAYILPKAIENKDTLLMEMQGRYGLDVKDFDELINSVKFKSLATTKVNIKRIYSWLGYFWWELYNDILSYKNIRFCKNCGAIITGGRSDRIYCSKEENVNCFNERLALRQRKSYYKNH
jgi:hypothetical protein